MLRENVAQEVRRGANAWPARGRELFRKAVADPGNPTLYITKQSTTKRKTRWASILP